MGDEGKIAWKNVVDSVSLSHTPCDLLQNALQMDTTTTLVSLAMLKVHVDQGQDYLDYLKPFVLQVLFDHNPETINDSQVQNLIRNDFGLIIPERVVQIVLKRIARSHTLKREQGIYRITNPISSPGIPTQKAAADRHIKSIAQDLTNFSQTTVKPFASTSDAVTAICAFLSHFNIPFLKAFLRGTALPPVEGNHDAEIVIVSKYVLHLQEAHPERLDSFLVIVKGHMLANALLCPDLQNAPKTYHGVTFFLDTPLLVRRIGLEGLQREEAVESLIALLKRLGGEVAVFSHTRDELSRVIRGAADHVESRHGRGAIVQEARKGGATRSDLLLLANQVDDKLDSFGITIFRTPPYITSFQIDETVFEQVLSDEISYFNPKAIEYDINSVRSVYVLRSRLSPTTLERCKAILVTNNAAFSRAAFTYGLQHEASRQVSSVITDFSLANVAWLKAPLGAPSLPMMEVLSFAYAAMRPSNDLLDKYLKEIDKLQEMGEITPRDHQLLRSSQLAQDELMNLTLGEETELTAQTITETLRRVTEEIQGESRGQLSAEQSAHLLTQKQLVAERDRERRVRERVFWRCKRLAKNTSMCVAILAVLLVIAGVVSGIGLQTKSPMIGAFLLIGSCVVTSISTIDMIFGCTVKEIRNWLERKTLAWLLYRESVTTGMSFGEWERSEVG